MSALPSSLLETLDADQSLWRGAPPRVALERWVASVPEEVRDALLSALVDPERHGWSRAALWGIDLALSAGASATGLATDDVVELRDQRGERFGLVPLAFDPPASPLGPPEDAQRLLSTLDRVFGHRKYIVSLRRPVPAGLDLGPISSAVQLWLAQLDRGPTEQHATYEDADVSIDFTVVDASSARGGRVLTIGPMQVMEQLGEVDGALTDAASRCEESLGNLPLVMVIALKDRWRVPRGFVQQLLYGTPDAVRVEGVYEADFTANGRSLFSDPSTRGDNPWALTPLTLALPGPRFAMVGEADRRGRVTLRWDRHSAGPLG
jgi:hypothetical protein